MAVNVEEAVYDKLAHRKADSSTLPLVDDDEVALDVGYDEATTEAVKKAKQSNGPTAKMDNTDTGIDGDVGDKFELGSRL